MKQEIKGGKKGVIFLLVYLRCHNRLKGASPLPQSFPCHNSLKGGFPSPPPRGAFHALHPPPPPWFPDSFVNILLSRDFSISLPISQLGFPASFWPRGQTGRRTEQNVEREWEKERNRMRMHLQRGECIRI